MNITKTLKFRLAMGSIVLILSILLSAHFALKGATLWCVAFAALSIINVLIINKWFHTDVIKPINALVESTTKIAEGVYGIQCTKSSDNEIGKLTDEINEMSTKIALTDQVRTDFISQVSHELRTPLTAITGWSELLADEPGLSEDGIKGIKIISKEANRLTGMVTELLEFTRIQDGRFHLRIELMDITAELEDAMFTYGELINQAGLEVNYEPPEREIPLIPGDAERLKQVFLNLLDNAATHGVEGGKIDVSIDLDNNNIIIQIRDYGRGIPQAELPHVKELFYKGSSRDRGTGIGLAVCDEIIFRHDGTLDIANAEGGGCLATITLPVKQK